MFLTLEAPAALRDFFMAQNAAELALHGQTLAKLFVMLPEAKHIAALSPEDWQETEYAFNRLFIGPGPVAASPHASAHLTTEPQLMGAATLEIRQLLSALQLAVPHEGQMPDDHICYELDAWIALSGLCGVTDHAANSTAPYEACHWLLAEHMSAWIPDFVTKARNAAPTAPIVLALSGLQYWLEQSLAHMATLRRI